MSTDSSNRERPDDYLGDWKEREALAEGMIPLVGKLYRGSVKTYLYGQNLVNLSVLEIMQAHRTVRQIEGNELSEFETFPVMLTVGSTGYVGKSVAKYFKKGAQNPLMYLNCG